MQKTMQQNLVEMLIDKGLDGATIYSFMTKYDLGLFEDPYRYGDAKLAAKEVNSLENRNIARNTAAQSMVLLKNEKGNNLESRGEK